MELVVDQVADSANVNSKQEKISSHPLDTLLEEFLSGMDDYNNAIHIAIPSIAKKLADDVAKCAKELSKFEDDAGELKFTYDDPHETSKVLAVCEKLSRLSKSKSLSVLERSLFVGLFSQYDVFIGKLLSGIYLLKPELFRNISREISLSDLLEFDSLDSVKLDMLDKEIESIRRESYIEQFLVMEKKFTLPLRKFREWPAFVELGQRRNLMTHTGGIVSEQYLSQCDKEGFIFTKRPVVGDQLMLGADYFKGAISILSKVAFMLTHTLWRKLMPVENDTADIVLNRNIYDLLKQKRWGLAADFGEFGLSATIVKSSQDMARRMRTVNTAIALTRLGKKKEAFQLMDGVDWSACIREFKLADAVLRERTTKACEIMLSIGMKGELIDELAYHQWPLFDLFRNSQEFHVTYLRIFSVPFLKEAAESAQAVLKNSDDIDSGLEIRVKKPAARREKLVTAKKGTRNISLKPKGRTQVDVI